MQAHFREREQFRRYKHNYKFKRRGQTSKNASLLRKIEYTLDPLKNAMNTFEKASTLLKRRSHSSEHTLENSSTLLKTFQNVLINSN